MNPAAPIQKSALTGFTDPDRLFVAGRYAYIVETSADRLKRVDISGVDVTSLTANSLEAGRLRVASDVFAQGDVRVSGGIHVGNTGLFSSGDVSVVKSLTLSGRASIPAVKLDDQVQLFSAFVANSAELQVRDEAGNVTTLSPHNFSLIGQPSEPLAWSYFSSRDGREINVDMLKAIRLIERLSGEKLVHISGAGTVTSRPSSGLDAKLAALAARLDVLEAENQRLKMENETLRPGQSSQGSSH